MKKILKAIYNHIPFKQQLFTLLKYFWVPPDSVYKHLYFKGVMNVNIDADHSFMMRSYGFSLENKIFWEGLADGWEKESTRLWVKLCLQADVVLDIGANTGLYTLIAKAMNPAASVYAFEPVDRVCKKLEDNIRLNRINAVALKKAASDKDGSAIIYDTGDEHIYSVTVNLNMAAPSTKVTETTIETIRLDTFISEYNISKVDLVKIDVETHEPEVLEGFIKGLTKYKPALLIEILNDDVGNRVNALVDQLDYLYFNIDENNGIRQVDRITKSDYYNYLLCNRATALMLELIKSI